MNIIQMGLAYTTDRMGRTKLVKLDTKEQERLMKSYKRENAARKYNARQRAEAQKKAA